VGDNPRNTGRDESNPNRVATYPFPPFGHKVAHNDVGVVFIRLRSPKVAPQAFGATLGFWYAAASGLVKTRFPPAVSLRKDLLFFGHGLFVSWNE